MARLMEYADRMQVDRLIFFMGFPWANDPTPDDFRRQNDQVIQALAHWRDRALGLAYINPRYEQESLAEIERCVKNGPLVGIKLWVAVRCNDPRLDSIIRRTHELQGLIYQHTWIKTTGNLPGEEHAAGSGRARPATSPHPADLRTYRQYLGAGDPDDSRAVEPVW
ncbi:MAG: hypothetical protein U0903_09435 [Planctomycetales bacterium]